MIRGMALLAALSLWCGAALGATVPASRYRDAVENAAVKLQQAARAGDKGEAMARAALRELPEKLRVETGKGLPPVDVDNRRLIRSLGQQVGEGREGIVTAAEVVRNLGESVKPASGPGAAEARQALAAVLKGSEFRPSRLAMLRERIYRWIGRVLDAILGHVPDLGLNIPNAVKRAILLALVGAAGLAAVILVVRLVLGVARGRARGPVAAAAEPVPTKSHAEWLAEAEERSQARDYRAALRALHMAALRKLDEAGLVTYDDSFTDGRFVRLLREKGLNDLADVVAMVNHLFSASWYGSSPAGPDEYRAARTGWSRLEALAAS